LAFIGMAVVARLWPIADWETALVTALALREGPGADAVRLLNRFGNLDAWALVVIGSSAAVAVARGMRAALLVALSFAVDAVNFLFKLLVERARPELDPAQLLAIDDYGFPSGHTARATAFAGALVFVLAPARWRLVGGLVTAAVAGFGMAYARVAVGVHFPLDTIGGLALGLAWFAWSTLIVLPRWKGGREMNRAAQSE
jgi:undecaprenyl-diphosphatase